VAAPPVWCADVDELRGHAPISASAFSNQNRMSISGTSSWLCVVHLASALRRPTRQPRRRNGLHRCVRGGCLRGEDVGRGFGVGRLGGIGFGGCALCLTVGLRRDPCSARYAEQDQRSVRDFNELAGQRHHIHGRNRNDERPKQDLQLRKAGKTTWRRNDAQQPIGLQDA
jgi:hypothetical protein